jgi:YgiT-type zinc finger domain-containing protein
MKKEMEQTEQPTVCDRCQVALVERIVTHEVLRGDERFDIEGVPVIECPRCGERWISSEVQATIDLILQENP